MRAVPFHVVLMLRCVALWLGFFSAHRLVFLLFGHTYSFQASAGEWCQTFANGLSMDLSAAGYMLALPVLCWCIGAFTAGAFFRNLAHWLRGRAARVVFLGNRQRYRLVCCMGHPHQP